MFPHGACDDWPLLIQHIDTSLTLCTFCRVKHQIEVTVSQTHFLSGLGLYIIYIFYII